MLHSFLANMYRLWVHWHAYQCNERHEQFWTIPSAYLRFSQFCKMSQDVQGAKCFKLMLITVRRLCLPISVIAANGPVSNLGIPTSKTAQINEMTQWIHQWIDSGSLHIWMNERARAGSAPTSKHTASLQPSTSRMQQSYCISSYSYYIECNPNTSKGQFPCVLYIGPHRSL